MEADWRLLTILSILSWGLWGFLSKYVSGKIAWGEILVLLSLGTVLVALVATPGSFALKLSWNTGIGLLAGIFCALGYLFFYRALIRGQASTVIPITSLYIVVVAVLAIVIMQEPLTIKKACGILSAVMAIVLLA